MRICQWDNHRCVLAEGHDGEHAPGTQRPETPGGLTFAEIGRQIVGLMTGVPSHGLPFDQAKQIGRLAADLVTKGRA